MSATMAKKKPGAAPEGDAPRNPISYRPSKVVAEAMEDYRAKFEFKPDKSAILERALRQFFREKGYDIPSEDEE